MPKCSYCNKEFERGTGKMFIQNTGKILWFCAGKCQAYMLELERSPLRQKWTHVKTAKKVEAKAKA